MSALRNLVSGITRRFPGISNLLRTILPLSMKRKIGAMLVPSRDSGTVNAKDGRKFVMIPDRVMLQVIYDGIFEPSLTNVIERAMKDGDICVDVGANFGWFATLMAKRAGTVVAYEPAGRIRGILEQNTALNNVAGTIDIRALAVGAESGEVTFVIEGDQERESALGHVATDGDAAQGETVQIVRMDDDLAAHRGNIALIKMDAEGFEHYAFQGAAGLLTNADPPVVITEANAGTLGRSGSSREALCAELEQHGYTLFGMNADGSLYHDNEHTAPALVCLPPRGRFADRLQAPQ